MPNTVQLKDKNGNAIFPVTDESLVTGLNYRPYNSSNPDGMGYLVLKKNKTFAEQVTDANTIYEIRYDYDLDGATITMPAGAMLNFEGGSLRNGTIDLNGCTIEAKSKIFENVVPSENSIFVQDVNPMWFGAKGDGVTDDTDAWVACLAFVKQIKPANLNSIRQYTRPQARISAPKHAHFRITRALDITFQCDIVGGFRFDYYGAYPAENTGIINFYGTFSQCRYEFDVIHASTTSTTPFYPNWTNVPQFAGVCVGSAEHPTIMEECHLTIGVNKCQIGIRLYGHSGSYYISCNTFERCRFSVCIIGIENHINEVEESSAWNNDMKFLNCEYRISTSGNTFPANTERCAFVKVTGNGRLQMNSSIIDGLSLEGRPHNLPTSILWVEKTGVKNKTIGTRISNVRIENIGTSFIKSNCGFNLCVIDNTKLQTEHFYVTLNNVTFDSANTEIPGFVVLTQDYARPIYTFDNREVWDAVRPTKHVSPQRLYRLKNTLLLYDEKSASSPKSANYASTDLYPWVTFLLKNGGTLQFKNPVNRTKINTLFRVMNTNLEPIDIINNDIYYSGGYAYKNPSDSFYWGVYHATSSDNIDVFIGNNTGADLIVAACINGRQEFVNDSQEVVVYANNASVWDSGDNYLIEGTLAERPNLFSVDNGYEYYCTENGKKYTFDAKKGWLTESGYTADVKSGATDNRPSLSWNEDGYKFYDTTIRRNIYSKIGKTAEITQVIPGGSPSTAKTVIIDNTLIEGQIYWCGYDKKQSWGGSVSFRKTADSSEGEIQILSNFNSNDKGVYFTAPSPTEYPYIYVANNYSDPETVTFEVPSTSWVEDDGATAGVKRNGATSERPASADIYVGFLYFDTSLGKMIAFNGSDWVNMDGTAL